MTLHPIFPLAAACILIAGCSSLKTKDRPEAPLDEARIKKALTGARPPQQFGFSVYPTGDGVAMQGSARLHPRHMATASFVPDSLPAIKITGTAARQKMIALIDPSAPESWMEFSKAQEFKVTFLGLDGRTIPYRGNTYIGEVQAYAAVVPQMRIEQLFIESSPVFVRMASHSLGPLNRGVQDAKIGGLIGYDILRNFEYVQFDLANRSVSFSATVPYVPSEPVLVGEADILNIRGMGLAVAGSVNGEQKAILLDFAGDYPFAMKRASAPTKQVELGEVVYVDVPTIEGATRDGLPRAGARMLGRYVVTICPRIGKVYFEQPTR